VDTVINRPVPQTATINFSDSAVKEAYVLQVLAQCACVSRSTPCTEQAAAVRPTLPPSMGTGALSGIKRLEREAHNSFPSTAEVKNAWSDTSTLPYTFMAWYLVSDNFTFTNMFTLLLP